MYCIGLVFLFFNMSVFERLLVHFNHFINLLLFSFYVNNVQMAFSWITTYRMRRRFDATGFFCDLMENTIIPKEINTHLIVICILVVGLMKLEVVFFLFCLNCKFKIYVVDLPENNCHTVFSSLGFLFV